MQYQKIVYYRFEVCDTPIDITDIAEDGRQVVIEEVEKNGQEDTHMKGVLEKSESGHWKWVEGEHMFRDYGSDELADGIVEYLGTHGIPQAGEQSANIANPVDPFIRSVLVPQQQELFDMRFTFDRIGTVQKGEYFLGGHGTIERWDRDDVPPVVSMIVFKAK